MSRIASTALGGFYATPPHLIPRIAALISATWPERPSKENNWHGDHGVSSILDPCAGEGEAVHALAAALGSLEYIDLFACEMEPTRFAACKSKLGFRAKTLYGDAFRTTFSAVPGVGLLYLNPPYDYDRAFKRTEEKFLVRFTPTLCAHGVLVFVVPYHELAVSAKTLADNYTNIACFRLPGEDWDTYKQVVLVATRREEPATGDPSSIETWAADPTSIPELPESPSPVVSLPIHKEYHTGLDKWQIHEVDISALLMKSCPWERSLRTGAKEHVPGVLPVEPVESLMIRYYPLATPPRPAHIAAAIASGVFNGAKLSSNQPGQPQLLVKGVFDRDFKTIEEKKNKDGDVVGEIQVQQPKLVVTVLDLDTHELRTLSPSGITCMLTDYSASLMDAMRAQCPVAYDPKRDADKIQLPETARKPFVAQGHAVKAIVMQLGGPNIPLRKRARKNAILLGELGVGKSAVALTTAKTIGAKRMLVMCPPHLLQNWTDEVAHVDPAARVVVLEDVRDLAALESVQDDRFTVAVLSRETAKLGHAWESMAGTCSKCGGPVSEADHAKTRARCSHATLRPNGRLADSVVGFAHFMQRYSPQAVSGILTDAAHTRMQAHVEKLPKREWVGVPRWAVQNFLVDLLAGERTERNVRAIIRCLFEEPSLVASTVRALYSSEDYQERELARRLVWLIPPKSELQTSLVGELGNDNNKWQMDGARVGINTLADGKEVDLHPCGKLSHVGGIAILDGTKRGTIQSAERLLSAVTYAAQWSRSKPCGEPLFCAIPQPRRMALARVITKKYPKLFDMLVLDEHHENAAEASAQALSAMRLIDLGLPTIAMTGSVMNGYAESLFNVLWAMRPEFRAEFNRDQRREFVTRYGYRKRLLEDRDESGTIVEYGSMSDRVERKTRDLGDAPGVLPLLLLRHLLPISVTLHKVDLALDLPKCAQERVEIQPSPEMLANYKRLASELKTTIRRDMFDTELAGKLWGQMAELPSYLDRCTRDVGNGSLVDAFEIRYPESVGGALVDSAELFDPAEVTPKEEWLLKRVEAELAEGRNVMVFAWHVAVMPRLARLLSAYIGEPVPVLHADKVPTHKRQAWIDKEVVKKKRRVMVANPVTVQTGLNNLVWFCTEIWMESPACNPLTVRQAVGRVDRIGQKKATRILFPVYGGTLQVNMYDLLMRKIAVSVATDGLDPESALLAAGIGDQDSMASLSIGKQLYAMLELEYAA